jgi:ubiquitin-protein ligase E3 C
LQTISKINRTYQFETIKLRRDVLSQASRESASIAMRIASPEHLLHWGLSILSAPSQSEEKYQAQESYIVLLSILLQVSTGLHGRHSTMSPLLTKLAFSEDFVEKLWRYVLVQVTNCEPSYLTFAAFSVFSDIFAHRLIALRDDQFLEAHTTMNGSRVILAEVVIARLRDFLYELYWNQPVRAADVKPPFASPMGDEQRHEALRGRLMITGTKLWNSLYERWCRLVRQSPFCDESTWLFPHLTTLSHESPVVAMHGADGTENMDLDDGDSSDEEMAVDPANAADAETEELAGAFSDPKMARILTCIPQALPFDRRVKLFTSLLATDKMRTQDEAAEMRQAMLNMMRGEEMSGLREQVSIHRDQLYNDSMRQLNSLGSKLRKRVQVTFINQLGAQEAGIDGGGVFKEFIDDLIKDAFLVEESSTCPFRLFTVTPLETLAVNTSLPQDASILSHYEFLGRVLAKAVYESILVDPQFCLPFLNQLLGKSNTLEDLKNFDPEYYRNLTKLLHLSANDINSLGLTFELTLGEGSNQRTVELIRGGHSTPVSKQNVIQYVHLVASRRLNTETALPTKAFLTGFRDIIPASWVRLFSAYELQKLISGDDSVRGIDVRSLKAATQYAAGYHPSQLVVQWFWEILDEFSPEEQRKFLKFMTSCSRQPLLGFSSLEPAPCIQQIRLPENMMDPERNAPLPTSSTCMNLLKLPNYRSKELMRQKLRVAIDSGAGFELT